jgi:hypothetical protein
MVGPTTVADNVLFSQLLKLVSDTEAVNNKLPVFPMVLLRICIPSAKKGQMNGFIGFAYIHLAVGPFACGSALVPDVSIMI